MNRGACKLPVGRLSLLRSKRRGTAAARHRFPWQRCFHEEGPRIGRSRNQDSDQELRFMTRPGTEFLWVRIMLVELADFLLQFARLANFGGMDLLSSQSIPAETDNVVLVLCCILCRDLVVLGLTIFH